MAADVRHTNRDRTWLRSSLCNPGKNCVEVGRGGSGVVIRDSKSRTTLHALDDVRWTAFLAHCRAIL
jgi:hypothetical protein